ncbi:MAG: hypothetical protein U1E98_02400 [Moraxella osloensis]
MTARLRVRFAAGASSLVTASAETLLSVTAFLRVRGARFGFGCTNPLSISDSLCAECLTVPVPLYECR